MSFDGIDRDKIKQIIISMIEKGGDSRIITREIMELTGYEYDLCDALQLNSFRKYMAEFNKQRYIQAGIKAFEWSDSGDNRVCQDCSKRNGEVFLFVDNPLFPGESDGCRCVAYAIDEDELKKYLEAK